MSGRAERRAAGELAGGGRRGEKADRKRALAEDALAQVPGDEARTPRERGFQSCPCPKDCTLHGECLLCVAYHGRRGRSPRCLR